MLFHLPTDNEELGGKLSRKGRYFDRPQLYSKVKRADRRTDVDYHYFLRQPTAEENPDIRFALRLPGYQERIKALSEEYNALDKNDAEEMADFRARKRTLEEVDIPEFDESPKLSLRDPIE